MRDFKINPEVEHNAFSSNNKNTISSFNPTLSGSMYPVPY